MNLSEPRAAEAKYPGEFRPFWDGLRRQRISFPRCTACGRTHWYPMNRCPHCLGGDFDWPAVSGRASLHSWTVVRRAFSPEWTARLPYVVGLVEFGEVPGTRLITNIVDCALADLAVDMALDPVFSDDGVSLPTVCFRPSASRTGTVFA